ncbi:STAS domain-containing protein [Phytohabitans flavus]|nr:STAS domain-containing protein [Phytohabitans flavus]
MIDELGPAPAALLVSAVRDRRGMRLVVAGDVDVISAWQFREYLAGALDTTPASLTVDLGGVTFLDSTGLSALVYAHQRARHEGVPSWWPIRNRRYAGSSMSPAC